MAKQESVVFEWANANPVRAVVGVVFMLLLAVAMGCYFVVTTIFPNDADVNEVEDTTFEEVPDPAFDAALEITPTLILDTAEVTETPIPDEVVQAIVKLTTCELEDGCMVPVWKTYERKQLTGRIRDGAEVSVVGCYYPVVQIYDDATPDIAGAPAMLDHSEYVLEGLWCEVVYTAEGEDTVKGLMQYWLLEFDLEPAG